MNEYRDPLAAAHRRIDALEAELGAAREVDPRGPDRDPTAEERREPIQRNPRRAWPLAVVLGVPTAILLAYSALGRRLLVGDESAPVVASLVALPLMLVGSYHLAIPPRAPARAAALLALAACALTAALAWGALDPAARGPAGWPARLPRYPGRLIAAEPCDESSGGATFRPLRSGGKGRAPGVVGYERALVEAELPSNRFATSCPALGVDCSLYRAASLEIVECYADETKAVARVRYGATACPSGPAR
ncbi:MAG: hypothetical protein JNL38_08130 [Myxococcales bacterium]|nr:hypothetical protein [Myxococcales bacterium]